MQQLAVFPELFRYAALLNNQVEAVSRDSPSEQVKHGWQVAKAGLKPRQNGGVNHSREDDKLH